jgi:hypothetical protein
MRMLWLVGGLLLTSPSLVSCQDAAPTDDALYEQAARKAWSWVDRNYRPTTGLVRATDHYALVTTWDIGSGLLALHSAHGLGLLPTPEFEARMAVALRTLQTLPLYDSTAFSRFYSAESGRMYGRDERPTEAGYGWSATDHGRLLIALKVIASNHPRFEGDVDRIVRRIDYTRIVREGYLWGEDVRPNGRISRYPEGRVGYEQYAAQGFALWGHRADKALSVMENARPASVEGVELLGDRRGDDRLTSEPFILAGLETDLWGDELNRLARGVLAAQEARFRRTGQLTMVSEDAIPLPPYHFYYYAVLHDGRPWTVDAQASMQGVAAPRWVSTKAAFAWHALHPSEYTRSVVGAVSAAHSAAPAWNSGIFEGSARLTGGANINTAAVILESALYRRLGHRLANLPAGS